MSERPAAPRRVLLVLAGVQRESGRMFALWVAALVQLGPVPKRQEGGRDRGLVRTCPSDGGGEDGEQREGVWQSGAP